MEKFKAILFDFDGTLVNSEKFHFDMLNELLAEYGAEVSWDEYVKTFMGVPFSKNTPMLVSRHDLPMTPSELVEISASRIKAAATRHPIETMPGVVEALTSLNGTRKAIVTGSGRESVSNSVEKLGWSDQFEFLVTFDDVTNSKPDPECYLKAVDQLGVPADEILVFEDTENGTKAAKAAGLTCFAIQSSIDYHPRLVEADQIFALMEEAMGYLRENGMV